VDAEIRMSDNRIIITSASFSTSLHFGAFSSPGVPLSSGVSQSLLDAPKNENGRELWRPLPISASESFRPCRHLKW
jgi:hypothetical protein